MSWKLAELRWRHDVGLQESAWECHNENPQSVKSQGAQRTSKKPGRQRSHTAPSDLVDGEGFQKACDGRVWPSLSPESPLKIKSYPDSTAFLRDPTITSTTPLLTPSQRFPSSDLPVEKMIDESHVHQSASHPDIPVRLTCQAILQDHSPPTDIVRGGTSLPTSPPVTTKSTSGTGLDREGSSSHTGDVYLETRTDDNSLNLSHRRVSVATSAIVNKKETSKPQTNIQSLESYVPDNDSLDHLSIPASTSFGIHFERFPSEDEKSPLETLSIHSSEYTFFPTCFRRPSIASKHHSDSCLLDKHKREDSENSLSLHSQNMRTLYPDLRSAHAQIQGHRVVSQPRSSGFEPRFPLSRSSSSSEDDDYFAKVLPISDAHIPLRHLACHRVPSAFGVLQVAEHHLESSAILESVEDNTVSKLHDRISYNADEIVSHYVEPFIRHGSSKSEFYPATPRFPAWNPNTRTAQCERGSIGTGAVIGTSAEDLMHGSISMSESRDGQTQGSSASLGRGLEAPEVDDYEWEAFPESSRSGFSSPSALRFRLTKKETGDVSCESAISRQSPATPWDPLPATHRRNGHHGLYRKTHLRTDQPHTFSKRPGPTSRETFDDHNDMQRIRRRSFPTFAGKAIRRHHSLKLVDLAHDSNGCLQHPQIPAYASAEDANFLLAPPNSPSSQSALMSSNVIDRALPSSSLLPKCSRQDSWRSVPFSDSINISSNSAPVPYAHANVSNKVSDTDKSNHSSLSGSSSGIIISERDRPTISGLIDMIKDAMDANEGGEGFGDRPSGNDKTEARDQQVYSGPDCNLLLYGDPSQRLECKNELHDFHFTGDSQRPRRGPFPKGNTTTTILKRTGIGRAGSSLADCSSSALQLCKTEDSGRHACIDSQTNAEVALLSKGLPDAVNNIYASSALPECTFSSRFNEVTPSSSESSAGLKAHGALRDVLIDVENCPIFPLKPAQLLITRLNGVNRIPFERVQLLKSGEWLEKAWCFVHNRAEFSHTMLAKKITTVMASDAIETQLEAGRFLLLVCVATYMMGGFVLAHDMGREGILSTSAMTAITNGAAPRLHPSHVRKAQAIEKGGLLVVFSVLVGCVGVLVWTLT
ncbi:hypothetical protein LTS17_000444 [Exophiala oligosperma]